MSFEDYIKAVIDYYQMGGTTWGASYMQVLKKEKLDLAHIVERNQFLNPAKKESNLGDFLFYVLRHWEVYP